MGRARGSGNYGRREWGYGVLVRYYLDCAPRQRLPSLASRQWMKNELENKHFLMGNVHGSHLPMRIRMELDILSQVCCQLVRPLGRGRTSAELA